MKLLNCALCGAQPKWLHDSKSYLDYRFMIERVHEWQASITCTGCRKIFVSGFGKVVWEGGNALAHQAAMQEAAKLWNRRPNPPVAYQASDPKQGGWGPPFTSIKIAEQLEREGFNIRPLGVIE